MPNTNTSQLIARSTAATDRSPSVRRLRSAVTKRAPGPRRGEQDEAEQQRPDDAVRDDLDRTGRLQQREVQREHAPQDVGADARRETEPVQRARGPGGRRWGSRAPDEPRSRLTAGDTSPSVRLQQLSPALQACFRALWRRCSAPSAGDPGGRHTSSRGRSAGPTRVAACRHHPVRVVRMQAGHRDDAVTASGPTTTSAPPRGVLHVSKNPASRPRRAALGALLAAVLALAGLTAAGLTAARTGHRRARHHATRREPLPVDLERDRAGVHHPAGPGRLRLRPDVAAQRARGARRPVVDLLPAGQLQGRVQAGHPRRVQGHDRHLPRRRRLGHHGRRRQPHVGPDQRGHRLGGHGVLRGALPRTRGRLRPAGLPQLQDATSATTTTATRCRTAGWSACRTSTRAATTCARRSRPTSTTSSRSASAGSGSTRPSTSPRATWRPSGAS